MSLQLYNPVFHYRKKPQFGKSCFSCVSVSATAPAAGCSPYFEEARDRIVKLIHNPELSISTYDTAWVGMVPAPHSSQEPCFPDCVNWLLDNQCHDGSWARSHHHCFLQKDVLSSTLACVLALKRWGVGEEHINRGFRHLGEGCPLCNTWCFYNKNVSLLSRTFESNYVRECCDNHASTFITDTDMGRKGMRFIELNFASATEKNQISPTGFDIIFPSMLEYASNLSLNFNLEPTTFGDLIHNRNLALKRCYQSDSVEMEAYMAYLSEGIGKLQDWGSVMEYQRNNGSLFNSPATTAAACIFHQNDRCLDYLHSALEKFGNAVPAIYPIDMYAQLCTVDNLERLGISRHFRMEIQTVLDETYRNWQQGSEEIFMDASTCALAFRILRLNGYVVSSDPIIKILEDDCLSGSFDGHMRDINTTLELYRATTTVLPDEAALDNQNLQLISLLEQKLSCGLTYSSELGRDIGEEVNYALQYPFYAVMERIANRRNIEHYNLDNTRILKTSFCSANFGNKDFLSLSITDFNNCQKLHREELKEIERWYEENRLNELKFRNKFAYCYFSTAATFFSPELSDARLSWSKNGVLATVVDDFFDIGDSIEDLKDLVQLFEAWDVDITSECVSQNVLIVFLALKSMIIEIGDKAFLRQERSVTKHLIDIWSDVLHTMMNETEWARDGSVVKMDEYMKSAHVSLALGPNVLPALYLVGPKLSEQIVQHSEYRKIYKVMSTCGRLLNDISGYEYEMNLGKLNAVPLYMLNGGDEITEEAAVKEMKRLINSLRKELLRLVLEEKNSVLPRACKDLCWHMSAVLHLFYRNDDGYTKQDFMKVMNNMIYEPIDDSLLLE